MVKVRISSGSPKGSSHPAQETPAFKRRRRASTPGF